MLGKTVLPSCEDGNEGEGETKKKSQDETGRCWLSLPNLEETAEKKNEEFPKSRTEGEKVGPRVGLRETENNYGRFLLHETMTVQRKKTKGRETEMERRRVAERRHEESEGGPLKFRKP